MSTKRILPVMRKTVYVSAISLTLILAGCAAPDKAVSTPSSSVKPTATATATPTLTATPTATPTPTETPTENVPETEPVEIDPDTTVEIPIDPDTSNPAVTGAVTAADIEACTALVNDINQYDFTYIYASANKAGDIKAASNKIQDRVITATTTMSNTSAINSLNTIAANLTQTVDGFLVAIPDPNEESTSSILFSISYATSEIVNTCSELQ